LSNIIKVKTIKKMKLKVYKAIALIAVCLAGHTAIAQAPVNAAAQAGSAAQPTTAMDINTHPLILSTTTTQPLNVKIIKVKLNKLKTTLQNLSIQTNAQVVAAINNINVDADVDAIAPQVNAIISNAGIHTITTKSYNDVDLVKNYSKTYSADAADVLSIENKYGSVTVNTWNRNEFKVDVQIKVTAGNQDRGQKILDDVNVADEKNGSSVAFRTTIVQVKNPWFAAFSGDETRKVEIDYTIYMPAKNGLVINNRYGAVNLPDLDGKVTIDCAYGAFNAKSLNSESTIRVKYGNAAIDNLGTCTLQLSYGDLTIGSVNSLVADVSYSPVKIGRLHSNGTINLRYGGGLKIGDLDKGVKGLTVSASYSNVDIGLSGDENADLSIVTHYGDFNYGDHAVTITNKSGDEERGFHPTKSYRGYIGKENSEKSITINTNYGNVKFN